MRGRKSSAGWWGCLLAMIWLVVRVSPRLSGAASISLPCDEFWRCLAGDRPFGLVLVRGAAGSDDLFLWASSSVG